MSRTSGDAADSERARRACLTCRQLKIKCIVSAEDTCERCQRLDLRCIFRARKNAAAVPSVPQTNLRLSSQHNTNVRSLSIDDLEGILQRLDHIENALGLLHGEAPDDQRAQSPIDNCGRDGTYDSSMTISRTIAVLRAKSGSAETSAAWSKLTMKSLWQSFHIAMPGLHFLPDKQFFTSPIPLLFAAMLYCSASRGPASLAMFAPVYYESLCIEIADLVMPTNQHPLSSARVAMGSEEGAYQTIIGLVLASLLSEGFHKSTGYWISIAYRLFLDQGPETKTRNSRQWQRILSGLQILDLEHCALYLSTPAVPLQAMHTDQLSELSRMMHVGLSHFAGRGIPTIWSYISQSVTQPLSQPQPTLSGVDSAVIRDWARQLDDWLARFSTGPFESDTDRKATYRQYVMHRLCVLSIYLPSRHCDIFSEDITVQQRSEILDSARATLRLHAADALIWSNWDMIMITWSALIVLQAIKMRHAELEDFGAITAHLTLLRQANEPTPNLRHMLADRLDREQNVVNSALQLQEEARQQAQQPASTTNSETATPLASADNAGPLLDPFALFDEFSLDFVDRYF